MRSLRRSRRVGLSECGEGVVYDGRVYVVWVRQLCRTEVISSAMISFSSGHGSLRRLAYHVCVYTRSINRTPVKEMVITPNTMPDMVFGSMICVCGFHVTTTEERECP